MKCNQLFTVFIRWWMVPVVVLGGAANRQPVKLVIGHGLDGWRAARCAWPTPSGSI